MTTIIIKDYVRCEKGEYYFSQQNLQFAASEGGMPFPVIIGENDPNISFSFWNDAPYLIYIKNPHIPAEEMSLSELNNRRIFRHKFIFEVENDRGYKGKDFVPYE